ncbi:alginate export family protein [Chryseolinea sp. T2]|uniref:alginate export family protein n=1 Tax=Chryseolinea sp. T2 TaxID=3129255 RepID=UPI0030786578
MFSNSTGNCTHSAQPPLSRARGVLKSFYHARTGKVIASCCLVFVVMIAAAPCFAQLSVSAQLRTRSELRDGQGTPSVADTVPAFFTSQRTRVSIGFTGYRFKLYSVIQDVRVWGQDASTVNRVTTSGQSTLMLHEAWGEISLLDTANHVNQFTLKVGRQELNYDDARLVGNLDWLQQARRHDAVLLKFENKDIVAHAGAAFNQNEERKSNTIYNGVPTGYSAGTNGIGTMYKSMQFLYAARKFKASTLSFLFFKDDFSKFHADNSNPQQPKPVYESGVWSRFTTGAHFTGALTKRINASADAFYQGGSYREGTSLNEYFFSFAAMYTQSKHFSIGPGVDLTSGNNGSDPSKKYQRFDPLYGTPHKFWGYMDYFYAADGFGPNGLLDLYLKTRFTPTEKSYITFDVHQFSLPNAVTDEQGNVMNKSLGIEFDLVGSFALTKIVSIEGGYSFMHMSSTMLNPQVKNVADAGRGAQWAWLMINIKPSFSFDKSPGK